jgi:hypothetical protein
MIARAIATRCCCPPDSASARFAACSAMPSRSRMSMARWMSSFGQRLNIVAKVERRFSVPCSTFETTSNRGTRLNCWKIIAHCDCHSRIARPVSAVTSRSSKRMVPEVESVSLLIIRSSVDLPAPERPMIPTIIGRSKDRLTLSTARLAPNDFVSWLISSIELPTTAPSRYRRCTKLS